MKMYKSKTWQYEKMGFDGACELFGVNIFDFQWKSTGECIKVKDPSYHTEHTMLVYQVDINGIMHTIGTSEFSNGTYGFYLYKY